MRRGDFAAAWQISDRILAERCSRGEDCTHWPRHLQFVWKGAPLEGRRVLVRCYHGLGDTLQFVRLLAPLRRKAAEVILWAQPALLPLLQSIRSVDRLVPLHEGTPEIDYDVDIELMEVMHALRITTDDLPGDVPYIHVSAAPVQAAAMPGIRTIGVCWSAGDWDLQRSIPAARLRPWRCVPNLQWFSLQYPPMPCPLPAVDIACRDIHEMAARMQRLDLVITVDTMVAHLAGALGLPVWLLLRHDPDWRWMQERHDTPWYPTMRLFRQQRAGEWSDVIQAVGAELYARMASSARYSFSRL
jgi:hypothetical protein